MTRKDKLLCLPLSQGFRLFGAYNTNVRKLWVKFMTANGNSHEVNLLPTFLPGGRDDRRADCVTEANEMGD
jgi:hypothetical protein